MTYPSDRHLFVFHPPHICLKHTVEVGVKEQLGLCALADVHVLNYRQLVGWLVWWVVARLQKIADGGRCLCVKYNLCNYVLKV